MGEPAIAVRGLVKRYGDRAVVDGLDLAVERGSIVALLGPNGAGKTTTVEIVEGYRRPDGGSVRVMGLDPRRNGTALRPRLGLMLQGGGLYPQARPRELLRLFAGFYADPRDPDELLATVGLTAVAETPCRALSGGERQRLSLALALVGRPEIAVLDEPTAGMDPAAKAATREVIADLRAEGAAVLVTTHELADVERLADRIAIIDRGRLVAEGTSADLLAGAAPHLRFRLPTPLDAGDRASLAVLLGGDTSRPVIAEDGPPGRYRIDGLAPSPAVVERLAAWCTERGLLVTELRTSGGTLEERYLELTGGAGAEEEA